MMLKHYQKSLEAFRHRSLPPQALEEQKRAETTQLHLELAAQSAQARADWATGYAFAVVLELSAFPRQRLCYFSACWTRVVHVA